MRGWTVDLCYRETLTSFSFFYLIYIYHHLPMNHIQCHSHSAYNHHRSPSTLSCHHSRLTDSHHCSSLTFSHHCLCLTQATIIHPLPLIHDHHPWISSSFFAFICSKLFQQYCYKIGWSYCCCSVLCWWCL